MAAGSAFKESWVNTLRERTPPRGGSPFHHRRRPTKNGGINKPLDRPPPPSRKADEAWGWFDQLDLDLISHTSRAPFPAATPDMLAEEEQKTQAMQKKRQEVAAARAEKKAKAAQAKAEQEARAAQARAEVERALSKASSSAPSSSSSSSPSSPRSRPPPVVPPGRREQRNQALPDSPPSPAAPPPPIVDPGSPSSPFEQVMEFENIASDSRNFFDDDVEDLPDVESGAANSHRRFEGGRHRANDVQDVEVGLSPPSPARRKSGGGGGVVEDECDRRRGSNDPSSNSCHRRRRAKSEDSQSFYSTSSYSSSTSPSTVSSEPIDASDRSAVGSVWRHWFGPNGGKPAQCSDDLLVDIMGTGDPYNPVPAQGWGVRSLLGTPRKWIVSVMVNSKNQQSYKPD
jgi:hypothetical protein